MDVTQFPITLSLPMKWRRLESYWLEDRLPAVTGGGEITQERFGRWVEIELPLEVIPQLDRVDLDSAESILDFSRRFGHIQAKQSDLAAIDVHGGHRPGHVPHAGQDLADHRGVEDEFAVGVEWLADFRAGAGAVLAGVLIENELEHGGRFSAMRVEKEWPKYAPWRPPANRRQAQQQLSLLLDFGLAHLVLTTDLDGTGLKVVAGIRHSLFARMVLEIVRAQAESLPHRRCAKCGAWFSAQSGGSRYHSRGDALYCSIRCARNMAQAKYRKRQENGEA